MRPASLFILKLFHSFCRQTNVYMELYGLGSAHVPLIETDHDGDCWACKDRGVSCDGCLPLCTTCLQSGLVYCQYGVRIRWPTELIVQSQPMTPATYNPPSPQIFASLGLSPEQNYLAAHYIKNIAKLALAVDYEGNGYRAFVAHSLHEPVLLNALLAVASSHLSKWRKAKDIESRTYLWTALLLLQQRFRNPALMKKEVTLIVMLLLITYEVFNGTDQWRSHYSGVCGWIRAYGNSVELNPFLKTWVIFIDTQSALNRGSPILPQTETWILSSLQWMSGGQVVDPLFGCSVKLPNLMLRAARLHSAAHQSKSSSPIPPPELYEQAEALQTEIEMTKIDLNSPMPSMAVSCHDGGSRLTATNEFTAHDLRNRVIATAEIFRHATHIYVFRAVNDPSVTLPAKIQESVDAVFDLFPLVPDALGPGANLGWALVVVGSEIDAEERREYIRCRWRDMNILGFDNIRSGQKVLDEVWTTRDLWHSGIRSPRRWQDVMQELGCEQILI